MKTLRTCLPALALVSVISHGVGAQTPPSPEGARALESQIQAALKQATAGKVDLPDPVAHFTAEGDHYVLRVPLAPYVSQLEPADAALTAKIRPLDATRWAIDDAFYPPEAKFTAIERLPGAPGHTAPNTVTYQFKFGEQDRHGVYDPTGVSASNSTGVIRSLDIFKSGGMGASLTHISRITSQSNGNPVDPSHVDIASDVDSEGYAVKFDLTDGTQGQVTIDRLHVSASMQALAQQQLFPLMGMAFEAAAAMKTTPASAPGNNPADLTRLRGLLVGAHGLLAGMKLDEEADGLKFNVAGHLGGISKVDVALGGSAPQDMLSAFMAMTVDGLVIEDLPPAFASYIPTHFTIRPIVSNVSVVDLTKMGMDATNADAVTDPRTRKITAPQVDYQVLFSHGGINVGFEQLGIDMAGAQLAGNGLFTLTGPQSMNGAAEITAHGLDALVTKLQGDPMMARALPFVIFLKGIAKTTGDTALWEIKVDNKNVLVNGVNLAAMAGAMK